MSPRLSNLWTLLQAHFILNALSALSFPVVKTVRPFCEWLFTAEDACALDWTDLEVLVFLGLVIGIKNRKWKPVSWKEYISIAFMFAKVANFILFFRADIRLAVLFFVWCIVLFVVFPEPAHSDPDIIKLFRGPAIQDELKNHPEVIWLIEFYANWSPLCINLAPVYAEIATRYGNDYFKFGKLDIGRYPVIGNKFRVDESALSKQVPTIILFENGKEVIRRPIVDSKQQVKPYTFNKENIIKDFKILDHYEASKKKCQRDAKLAAKQSKKDERLKSD